jgi:hypothetical protein
VHAELVGGGEEQVRRRLSVQVLAVDETTARRRPTARTARR